MNTADGEAGSKAIDSLINYETVKVTRTSPLNVYICALTSKSEERERRAIQDYFFTTP